jgi:hypothetical protein
MELAGRVFRVPARLAKPLANRCVSRIVPELARALFLRGRKPQPPGSVHRKPGERIADGGTVRLPIEAVAVAFIVMEANRIRRRHALDVRGPVVAAVEVDVMPVCARNIGVKSPAQIPFIGEPVRRIQVTVQWLIHGLVAAYQLAVQGHQRMAGP